MLHPLRSSKTEQVGLDSVLGSLERRIMAAVWTLGEATVSEAHAYMDTPNSYETVKTVMARLAEKGLLLRVLDKRAYVYKPAITQEELERQVSRRMIDSLLNGFGARAISQFADVLKENPQQFFELRALLNKMAEE